jgi:hypothetical protein
MEMRHERISLKRGKLEKLATLGVRFAGGRCPEGLIARKKRNRRPKQVNNAQLKHVNDHDFMDPFISTNIAINFRELPFHTLQTMVPDIPLASYEKWTPLPGPPFAD